MKNVNELQSGRTSKLCTYTQRRSAPRGVVEAGNPHVLPERSRHHVLRQQLLHQTTPGQLQQVLGVLLALGEATERGVHVTRALAKLTCISTARSAASLGDNLPAFCSRRCQS
jgi:hypothetical protein